MIITTAKKAKFDTSKPARSSVITILDNNGRKVMDTLRITGNVTEITEFMEKTTMIEVEHSFGIDEVNEDYLWQ